MYARLVMETQQVVALRVAKLMAGGPSAGLEAQRMVGEKMLAAGEAALTVAAGGHPRTIMRGYRRKVRANKRRLSRGGPGTE